MSQSDKPIILFTNDDGIESPGLWAVVEAFKGVGELLVVAPREQQSGMGRSMPVYSEGNIYPYDVPIDCEDCTAYAVDGTPAQAVQHGLLELTSRQPSLIVSGINYGENTGNGVTISGTVGAAIEAASFGIPAIAVSQQTPKDLHLSYSTEIDFSIASKITCQFAKWLIEHSILPDDVDFLKIDVPSGVTDDTEWRMTRLSRRRVYWPTRPKRVSINETGKIGYHYDADLSKAEPDSDIYAILVDKVISVTPMSLDMTSRTDMPNLRQMIEGKLQ